MHKQAKPSDSLWPILRAGMAWLIIWFITLTMVMARDHLKHFLAAAIIAALTIFGVVRALGWLFRPRSSTPPDDRPRPPPQSR